MAIENVKISNSTDDLFKDFQQLYHKSFPEFEQRTLAQQEKAFLQENYHLTAYIEHNTFIGFIAYWEFESFIYIEHFAITQLIRGQGYGYRVLSDFMTANTKIIILEIDPIVDEISAARLRFYEKCGFKLNTHAHIHPPYRAGYQGHDLQLLTTQREISKKEYKDFNFALQTIVMQ